jgi:hypothetical protein
MYILIVSGCNFLHTSNKSFHALEFSDRYIVQVLSISSSKMFPFSDHDIIITKLETEDINRGLDIWIMNRETIKI